MAIWKGLDEAILREAGVDRADDGLWTVPYRRPDGDVHAVRMFAENGRCWWKGGCPTLVMFGLERLPKHGMEQYATLLICEGESDALAARSAYRNLEEVRVLGLPGASTWNPAWRDLVASFGTIYLLGDGGDAGRTMNSTIQRDVPEAIAVWMPDGWDVRGAVQEHEPESLDELLGDALAMRRLDNAILGSETLDEARARLRSAA